MLKKNNHLVIYLRCAQAFVRNTRTSAWVNKNGY